MTERAEVLAALAVAIRNIERTVVLGNLTSEVSLEEYAELKALRRSVCGLYRRMANQGDLYRSNTGAADLIPNKIIRLCGWEHPDEPWFCQYPKGHAGPHGFLGYSSEDDGQTTGKHFDGDQS